MAVYSTVVITNKGAALYAKAQAGVTLNFTRMQIGGGQLSGQDPVTLTALITPISNFAVNSITTNGNTAHVKGIFENTSITVPTYSCELGLFAQDPDVGEILYAYANAGTQGDTIPPRSSGPLSKQYQINAAVGNATSVTATIPSDTYIPTSDKGASSGVAPLDSSSKVPIANLPAATAAASGIMSAADKAKLDAANASKTADTLVMYDSGGRIKARIPVEADDVARKAETDAALAAAAAAQSAANGAQSTADAALPKSGGTMTGILEMEARAATPNSYSQWIQFDYVDSAGVKHTDRIFGVRADGKLHFTQFGVAEYEVITSAGGTFTGFPRLGNGVYLVGKDTGGVDRLLCTIAVDNAAYFGDPASPLRLQSADAARINGHVIWTDETLRNNSGVLELNNGGVWTPVGGIKRIQRGSIAVTSAGDMDITITAVDPAKTSIKYRTLVTTSAGTWYLQIDLYNSTTLRINTPLSGSQILAYEIIEYN